MKTIIAYLLGLSTTALFSKNRERLFNPADLPNAKPSPYRHLVLLTFKKSASPEAICDVEHAFAALPAKIPTITNLEWGTDLSHENLAKGYTHSFILSFSSLQDLKDYLPHPAHKEFVKHLDPILENILVLDFLNR